MYIKRSCLRFRNDNLLYNKNDNTVEKYKHSREKTTKKKSIFIVQLEQIVVDWHPNHLV